MRGYTIILILTLIAKLSFSQWQQVNGPKSNFNVIGIASNDSFLLISATCGTFYSLNQGLTWTPINTYQFSNSAVFKDTLYINYFGMQVYNESGKIVMNNLSANSASHITSDLLVDNNILYATSSGYGFSYSYDARNWIVQNSGLPTIWYGQYSVPSISINNDYLFAGSIDGIYRKLKSSSQWVNINNGIFTGPVGQVVCNDSSVVISWGDSFQPHWIYKSNDNGNSWSLKYTFSNGGIVNDLKNINDTLYIGTKNEGLLVSFDWGDSWTTVNTGTIKNINSINYYDGEYLIGTDSGIFKNLTQLQNINNDIVCTPIRGLVQNDSCIAAVLYENVSISKDTGNIWINTTSTLPLNYFSSMINLNNSFVLSGRSFNCDNYKSNDNGNSWNLISTLPYNGDGYELVTNGSKILAITDAIVYLSSDSGMSWEDISPPSNMLVCHEVTGAMFSDDDIFLCECGFGEVIKSSDFGTTWEFSNSGVENQSLRELAQWKGILFLGGDASLYRSLDNGLSWNSCGNGLPYPVYYICDFAYDDQNIYACTNTDVFFSSDSGSTWNNINGNLPITIPNSIYGSLMVRDNYLYFGTNSFGIWRRSTQNLPINVEEPKSEQVFRIVPNPASSKFILEYHLKNDCTFFIYDMLGEMKTELTLRKSEGTQQISTMHWEDGMYFCVIKDPFGNTFRQKLLIQR